MSIISVQQVVVLSKRMVKLHFCSVSVLLLFVFALFLYALDAARRLLGFFFARLFMDDFFRTHRFHHSIFQKVWRRRRPRQVRKIVQERIAHVFLVFAVLPLRVFFPPFLQVLVVLFQFFLSQLVVDDDSFRVRLVALRDFDDVLRRVDGSEDVLRALDVSARRWVFSRHLFLSLLLVLFFFFFFLCFVRLVLMTFLEKRKGVRYLSQKHRGKLLLQTILYTHSRIN